MSENTTSLSPQQSLDDLRRIDDACTQFDKALHRGESPIIEDILRSVGADVRATLLRELLTQEMEFRAKAGESPSLNEYCERFSDDARLVKYLYLEHFIPTQVGEFSIQKLLGRGSFGLVYQGWDAKLTRTVAIKVFRRDPLDSSLLRSSPLVEARLAAQLRHPGVVTVYAVLNEADGDEFLVLEYVDGRSLEDLLRSERLSPHEATALLLAVTQALQHAHQQGLVHRDLKPANILLDHGRRPRVTDFGLALQLTTANRSPEIAGTLAYMAPEQASGETHRIDGRTDLWAIGVILYRLLSGRLPFSGSGTQELLEAIRYADPKDLRENDPTVPLELALIVRRCLAKRMSDRYQSAAELMDDLQAVLSGTQETKLQDRVDDPSLPDASVAVVPKGLRCFDANDREFFLQLVPGPRDRHGVPKAVRFWELHLRQTAADQTFRVGLVYGPSGCGKSSLVRAGIVPRLPGYVRALVVEATREETETGLIRELRRHFPGLSADLTLPETMRELREGPWLAAGQKLVLIFDQFEQWLHGWRQDAIAQLVETLRQCDGGRVQALILVRDDFWMPATRLFQQLDVPLVEGLNASAVDLFDRTHAMKVLTAFGVSYGRLEAGSRLRDGEQLRFLERAVSELAQDGWIVPVRLCIFAEMVKSQPWSPATLREVGGAQGLGAAFLEDAFDGRSAPPMYRLHRPAARLVLERLLPPAGMDIRGHLVPESELRTVSGYAQRPADFAALLRCLDHELRLITPSDSQCVIQTDVAVDQQSSAPDRLYQLTHDFLVTAIRAWLNQTRHRTLRGRGQLRLAEYASAYSARPESRQLPSWWEWAGLLLLTRPRQWRPEEGLLMQKATQHHARRSVVLIAALLLLGMVVYNRMSGIHANGLVQALATTDSHELPDVVGRLTEYQRWTRPLLVEHWSQGVDATDQRVRVLLGLLAVGEPDIDELDQRLLDVEPPLTVAVVELLNRFGRLPKLESDLWAVATDAQAPPGRRLRACVALARLPAAPRSDRWQAIADSLAQLLLHDVAANPQYFNTWVDALSPARPWLITSLQRIFADEKVPDSQRFLSANILGRYSADDPERLVELALQSSPKQFDVFATLVSKNAEPIRQKLLHEARASIPSGASEEDKDRLARRQSNAIVLLHGSNDDQELWQALRHLPDPRLRSFLLDHLQQIPTTSDEWIHRLAQERDPGIRQAIVLVLGGTANVSYSRRNDVVGLLIRLYRDDVDAGVHGAIDWTLRRLGFDAQLEQATIELAKTGIRPGYHWYVTKSLLTMVIIAPAGPRTFGSPESEPGRDRSDETTWSCNVDWSFAISAMEITQSQFVDLCPGYRSTEYLNQYAPEPTCPANALGWRDAAEFCRLLSQRDEVPETEMVIPRLEDLQKSAYPDLLAGRGYRLPLEIEWEIACRAGTITPRFFGYAPDLLPSYCCYIGNSGGKTWPVGTGMPNAIGLFDMLGNVSEWCYDFYTASRESQPVPIIKPPGFLQFGNYAIRGNDITSNDRMLRVANRRNNRPTETTYSRGFRIAHTVRHGDARENRAKPSD